MWNVFKLWNNDPLYHRCTQVISSVHHEEATRLTNPLRLGSLHHFDGVAGLCRGRDATWEQRSDWYPGGTGVPDMAWKVMESDGKSMFSTPNFCKTINRPDATKASTFTAPRSHLQRGRGIGYDFAPSMSFMGLICAWLFSIEDDLESIHQSFGTGLAFSVSMRTTRTGKYSDVKDK